MSHGKSGGHLLSSETVALTNGKWMKGIFVIAIKFGIISRVRAWKETFGVEGSRLDPICRIILNILQVEADDSLRVWSDDKKICTENVEHCCAKTYSGWYHLAVNKLPFVR